MFLTRAAKSILVIGLLVSLSSNILANSDKELLGAGASFPFPLYSKMFDVYHKETGIKINYQSIGSGGGIRQLMNKSIDFGASDAALSDEMLAKAEAPILHIPMCLGAVVVTYNLPNKPTLNMSAEVLADIFQGKIKKWNDPRIKAENPEVTLPKLNIMVVHRSDGSGTTFIFTDYLSKVSPSWKENVGKGKSVKWPTGLGAKGNEGVSGLIKQTKGSIGYCELAYALHNKLPTAHMKNKKGKFIKPEISSISQSAEVEIPADTRVSLTNTDAATGYPVSSFTWILVYKEQNYDKKSIGKVKTMVNLLWWMIHGGQKYCEPLDYAPLSNAAVKKAEAVISSITYDGTPVSKSLDLQ